jgi:hypothetical protein
LDCELEPELSEPDVDKLDESSEEAKFDFVELESYCEFDFLTAPADFDVLDFGALETVFFKIVA